MWGNLVTEVNFPTSYTFGFPNTTSDILLHLTHWQYWFWFWFTFFLVLYYFLFLRLIRYRTMKMSPKMATSFLSHGKWGDLIVCLIPLSWCANILSNSNFILRMIEWQSESSLFTVRVRGKQWYWVYKIEVKALAELEQASRNVGHNFWSSALRPTKFNYLGLIQAKHSLTNNLLDWSNGLSGQLSSSRLSTSTSSYIPACSYTNSTYSLVTAPGVPKVPNTVSTDGYNNFMNPIFSSSSTTAGVYGSPANVFSVGGRSSENSVFIERTAKYQTSPAQSLRLSTSHHNSLTSQPKKSSFVSKPQNNNFYLVIKQKRFAASSIKNPVFLTNSGISAQNSGQVSASNELLRNNPSLGESLNVNSSRRLLRTRRVLVLPAHTNVTIVTNSFDVMHSWFIPGLGVKLDCVPGRSTHHTLHIDHAGFYYGQCAEICGRYHHHMPIRVCALPFEHFLVWWYHYGSPFFQAGNQDRSQYARLSSKSLSW